MSSSSLVYPQWKAPRQDQEVLIWPKPGDLLSQTIKNHQRLNAESSVRIQGVPLNELRSQVRAWLGFNNDQPLLADGHQTELHHPGVWVKRIATDAAAGRLSGQSVHFAVDTDAPKHLDLRWPGELLPITDDPDRSIAKWTGLLDAPTPAHLERIDQALRGSAFNAAPAEIMFVPALRRLALEQPSLSVALTNALHELDWSLGLRHHAVLASRIWESEGFLVFVHHLIARAGEFAGQYNAALAEYRREKKIRTGARPMPDLSVSTESIELPFWLDELQSGERSRPAVSARGDCFVLRSPRQDEFVFDPSAGGFEAARELARWLGRHRLRLSPRALVLTMFLRVCCVDQFAHGIGGAQYDQVTDRIIASHFGLEPPSFSVVTATMYLPQAIGQSRVCIPCIVQEGHHLKHALLGEQKRQKVEQIAAAPRKSAERYALFAELHRQLSSLARTDPRMQQWDRRLRLARSRAQEEAALFDREIFYALQPRPRLEQMVQEVRALVDET
jgi:hypothetical protein